MKKYINLFLYILIIGSKKDCLLEAEKRHEEAEVLEEISKEANSQQLEELLVRLLNKLLLLLLQYEIFKKKIFIKFIYRLKKQYEYNQLYKYLINKNILKRNY